MNHEIRTERDRPLQGRRKKSVVDSNAGSRTLGLCGNRLDIDDAHQRIARRLDQHQGRRKRERCTQGSGIALIDEGDLDLPASLPRFQQTIGAAITIVRRDDETSLAGLGENNIYRSHPGTHDDSARAAFQLGQRIAQHVAAWIGRTRIFIRAALLVAVEGKRAGEIDRRCHRTKRAVRRDAICGRNGVEILRLWHSEQFLSTRLAWLQV